jgi:hypothetical protein
LLSTTKEKANMFVLDDQCYNPTKICQSLDTVTISFVCSLIFVAYYTCFADGGDTGIVLKLNLKLDFI